MNERIRKEALRAATKVALALTPIAPIAACGGSTLDAAANNADQTGTSQRDNPNNSASSDDPLVLEDSGAPRRTDAGHTDATTTDAHVAVVDAAVSDASEAKCAALLDKLGGDAGWSEEFPVTPDTTACCELALKDYLGGSSWEPDAGTTALNNHVNACCGVEWTIEPDYQKQPQWVHMACSPWGPPMPPAMVA